MASPSTISSRYEIRGIVGRGGMGLVYKAYDRVVGRDVAIKTLADIQGQAAVEMFYKEWRLLAKLHHPNIIEIFDIGEFDDGNGVKPFFVMPLLPGTTLDNLLRLPGQQVTPERLGELVSQVCRGLQAIHDSGLIHRDIKPSNIFVMEFNAVKIIDFGVAHLVGGNTVTGLKGTVSYMAPEQILNQECSPASDIFSLGVVCYEALCGARPFQGKNSEAIFEAILRGSPRPVSEVNPAISQTVGRVVHRALAKQPRQRYQSTLEFADFLQKALRGENIPEFDPTRIQPRIQRAIRAFEQANYQLASDILSDLETAGYIDPAIKPLRSKIDQALQRNNIRDLLTRAEMGIAEEEFTLALQNAEAALVIEPAHEEALRLRELIKSKIAERDVTEWLRSAEEAIEQYAFTRARQLLRNVQDLRPGLPKTVSLVQLLEQREQVYLAARQEKEELYKTAREAWENSEFATAAAKLERVLELETGAPDTTSPDAGFNCKSFLGLVRSAQTVVENTRATAMSYIAEGKFEAAVELCHDCTSMYPGHPVPPGLALLAESERKRTVLWKMSEAIRIISAEPDLEKKVEYLTRASDEFPNEPLFEQWTKPLRERIAHVRGMVAKARAHEESGRTLEALEQWRMIETIYPEYPPLAEALQRLGSESAAPATFTAAPRYTPDFDWAQPEATVAPPAPTQAATQPAPPPPRPSPTVVPARAAAAAPPEPTVATPSRPAAVSVPEAPAPPARPATRISGEPALKFFKQLGASLRNAMSRSADWARPRWNDARTKLAKSPLMFQKAGFAMAAALGVVLIIAAAMIFHAMRKDKTVVRPNNPPPKATMVQVSLGSATGDETVRLGDKQLTFVNGEMRGQLDPGSYTLTVEKDGYEPFSGPVVVSPSGFNQPMPSLRPAAAAVSISTDFQQGRVTLDDRPPATLQNGEFRAEDLAPGPHTLKISDGRTENKFEFTTADGQPPDFKGPIQVKDLQVVVVTGLGRNARVAGLAPTAKVAADDGRQPANEAGVFVFSDLTHGARQLIVGEGRDERRLAFDAGTRPLARFMLSTDRNVGQLMVKTGLDRFQVFLDGVAYNNLAIRNGVTIIPNLPAKSYRIRVAADGYEAVQETEVLVRKGNVANAAFTLKAVPQFSALAVHGLPPRTQVMIDGVQSGTTDNEGNFSGEKITPGERALEFRNPRYKPARLAKTFVARETLTLTAADVHMEGNPGIAQLKVIPDTGDLEVKCGSQPAQHFKGVADVTCMETLVSVTATAEGYYPQNRNVSLTPGVSVSSGFSLDKVPGRVPPPEKRTCGPDKLASNGWTTDQSWFAATSDGAALPCENLHGIYEFSVRVPKGGLLTKPVTWRIQGGGAPREFVLDKKNFSMRNGPKHDISSDEKDGGVTFRVIVEQGRILHQIRSGNNTWQQVEALDGDFHTVKIAFTKDARISGFSFREK